MPCADIVFWITLIPTGQDELPSTAGVGFGKHADLFDDLGFDLRHC
jgi:hypothetical protein